MGKYRAFVVLKSTKNDFYNYVNCLIINMVMFSQSNYWGEYIIYNRK
ncbi:hypothetical protein EC179100_4702 [Escherichia coli 179100]|nr:hypothetical protein EC179100_4702 [Escherichia coli 179100]